MQVARAQSPPRFLYRVFKVVELDAPEIKPLQEGLEAVDRDYPPKILLNGRPALPDLRREIRINRREVGFLAEKPVRYFIFTIARPEAEFHRRAMVQNLYTRSGEKPTPFPVILLTALDIISTCRHALLSKFQISCQSEVSVRIEGGAAFRFPYSNCLQKLSTQYTEISSFLPHSTAIHTINVAPSLSLQAPSTGYGPGVDSRVILSWCLPPATMAPSTHRTPATEPADDGGSGDDPAGIQLAREHSAAPNLASTSANRRTTPTSAGATPARTVSRTVKHPASLVQVALRKS